VEDWGTIGREAPERRDRYRHFLEIPTRWMDNDVYGHVNNVVYYSYFDTVVNGYLISSGSLDIERSPTIGLVVETQCRFFKQVTFPDTVHAGLLTSAAFRRISQVLLEREL
jgi:acyl-CoA thioester hydrolase